MPERLAERFERRLEQRLRAHADRAVNRVDGRAVAQQVAETAQRKGRARRWTPAIVALTVVLASALTVSALQLLPAGASPTPVPSQRPSRTGPAVSPSASASGSLAAPPVDEAGRFTGGLWARRGGALYLSTDGGVTWSSRTIAPNPVGVFVLDAQHAWTVSPGPGSTPNTGDPLHETTRYVVARTTDGGVTWPSVAIPGNYPDMWAAITFVDPLRGYLLIGPDRLSYVFARPAVFATDDDGASWRQVWIGQPGDLMNQALLAGDSNGTLWAGNAGTTSGAGHWTLLSVSRDGGATWQPVSLPGRDISADGDFLVEPPTVIGSTVVVAVYGSGPLTFYRSMDAGRTWQAIRAQVVKGPSWGRLDILDPKHWLVPAPSGLHFWITDDAGATWRNQAAQGLSGLESIFSLDFAADGEHGIAAVPLGNTPAPNGLFVTTDGGKSWRPAQLSASASSPTPAPAGTWSPAAVAVWSDSRSGLVGGAKGQAGRVDRTTDGGTTWTVVWRPKAPVVQLAAFGSADAVAVTCTSSSACTLWNSRDRGATWTAVGSTPAAVSFSDLLHGWRLVAKAPPPGTAVGGPGAAAIERTSDGGRTWQDAGPNPCGPGQPSGLGPTAIAARSATSAWLLCTGSPATIMEDKTVAVTTDGGSTWQVRARTVGSDRSADIGLVPASGHPNGLAIAPDGTAWMWGGRMRPLASHDGGRTWTDMALGEIDVSDVIAGSPLDSQRGWALLRDPNAQAVLLEVTTDGGARWSKRFSWPMPPTP